MQTLKLFIPTLIFALLLDLIWLSLVAKNLYMQNIGFLLRKSGENLAPNLPAAALVYVAVTAGILWFVIPKVGHSYLLALGWGALFGVVTYGVYDLTNFATVLNWPLAITIIDMCWGATLCGLTSLFAVWLRNWF